MSCEVLYITRRWQQSLHICKKCTVFFFLFSFRGSLKARLAASQNNSMSCHLELPTADPEFIHCSFPDRNPSRKESTNLSHHGKQHPGAPSALLMRLLCFRTSCHLVFPVWFLLASPGLCQSPRKSGSAGCLLIQQLSVWAATLQLQLFRHHP